MKSNFKTTDQPNDPHPHKGRATNEQQHGPNDDTPPSI
jgi:hypothetical protein